MDLRLSRRVIAPVRVSAVSVLCFGPTESAQVHKGRSDRPGSIRPTKSEGTARVRLSNSSGGKDARNACGGEREPGVWHVLGSTAQSLDLEVNVRKGCRFTVPMFFDSLSLAMFTTTACAALHLLLPLAALSAGLCTAPSRICGPPLWLWSRELSWWWKSSHINKSHEFENRLESSVWFRH